MDLWIHYNVGPDNARYLCAAKMKEGNKQCPICDEIRSMPAEDAAELRERKQVLTWIIDREKESEGPKLYPMPWTLDRDICKLSQEEDSKSYLMIDDPDDGFDVEFQKEGTGLTTKYGAIRIARKPTPMTDDQKRADAWLEVVDESPLPKMIKFWPYDHIKEVFSAQKDRSSDDDDDDEKEERGVRTRDDDRGPSRDNGRSGKHDTREEEEEEPRYREGSSKGKSTSWKSREERVARRRDDDDDDPRSLKDIPEDEIPFKGKRGRDDGLQDRHQEEEDIRDRVRKGLADRKK